MIEFSKLKMSGKIVHRFSGRVLLRPDWHGSHAAGAYQNPQIWSTEEERLEDISRETLI